MQHLHHVVLGMRAALLTKIRRPLEIVEVSKPVPKAGELLVKVFTCGICRTDLHIIDGDLPETKLPLIPGHQIVGEVASCTNNNSSFTVGQRVGIPWLSQTCGTCGYCLNDQENLCDSAKFTGYHRNGGFAEYCTVDEQFCFPLPDQFSAVQAAPLLCAGLIGYRSYRMVGNVKSIGFFGFGAAAHLLVQVAVYENRNVFAFTREDDSKGQEFARQLGAKWAGSSSQTPPQMLDAAIIFAPVGSLVPVALRMVRKGGVVVCAGIHMSEIPAFPYELLWGERKVVSVANLTRRDGEEFLNLAATIPVRSEVHLYELEQVNTAIEDLRVGRVNGSAVIKFCQ